ncbi:hypothetical protein ACQPW3_08220 [Actinosynnema sp. CA-248983]
MELAIVLVEAIGGFGAAMVGIYVAVLVHYTRTGCQRCVRRFLPRPVRRLLAPLLGLLR